MEFILYIVLLFMWTLLMVLLEGVVLTLLRWASFRQSLVSSLVANLVSTFISIILLALVKQPQFIYVTIGWMISSLIDSMILVAYKKSPIGHTITFAIIANLASYAVLILPVFYFGQAG
jgi:hypothetical protein